MVNINKINEYRAMRLSKIESYATAKKISKAEAAMFIDFNAPPTTNKAMLAKVGYNVDEVTLDNLYEVITALGHIGVNVIGHEKLQTPMLIQIMNNVINEEVSECWGGPDMQEFVDVSEL